MSMNLSRKTCATRCWRLAAIPLIAFGGWVSPAAADDVAPTRPLLLVPGKTDQAAAQKVVHELFAADFAKHAPSDQLALCRKLLAEAQKSTGDPTAQFVLLSDAKDAAVSAGNTALAFLAVDAMVAGFKVERDPLYAATLNDLLKSQLSSASCSQAAGVAEGLVTRSLSTGDYPAAERIAGIAETFAQRSHNTRLLASARTLTNEVRTQSREYDRYKGALEKLKKDPGDADANLVAGTYLCFTRNLWPRGLAFMIKGSDPQLKAAAQADLTAADSGAIARVVADRWWEVGETKSTAARQAIRRRAAEWYRKAMPSLSGLTAELAQKRIVQSGESIVAAVDLLALIDPQRDAVNGSWSIDHGVLTGNGGAVVRLEIPYEPTDEYELHLVYTYTTGSEGMMLMLPMAKKPFMMVINPQNAYCEEERGPFGKVDHAPVKRGEPCNVSVHVRRDRVQAYVNDQQVADFQPADHDLGIGQGWRVRDDKALGLGNWNTTVVFSRIEITEAAGAGVRLR